MLAIVFNLFPFTLNPVELFGKAFRHISRLPRKGRAKWHHGFITKA